MRYKIVNTKTGRKPWRAKYAKTMGEARELAYIKARGISRVMWAMNATNVGAKVPSNVQKLISNLQVNRPELNEVSWAGENTVKVENKVRDIERYKNISMSKAEEIASKRMEHLIRTKIGGKVKNV